MCHTEFILYDDKGQIVICKVGRPDNTSFLIEAF